MSLFQGCDVVANWKLLPIFNEWDPDTFFHTEPVVDAKKWPDLDCMFILVYVYGTNKWAEGHFIDVCRGDPDCETVRADVLQAYELFQKPLTRGFEIE